MLGRYSHIRMEAKRKALAAVQVKAKGKRITPDAEGTEAQSDLAVAQEWA
jgi:hypothetical protein